ncbi:MAG: phosphoenolpyruvate--protein phosphotransferase [Candidatus Omnitrophica bacterium]|nr:phosphoenolpyruvate--protein phosphotransferase [Candidatus Omnitrophota bacterium]
MKIYQGIGITPGIAIGRACVWKRSAESLPVYRLRPQEVEPEVSRLQQAIDRTEQEILRLQEKMANSLGPEYGQIFAMYRVFLQDKTIREKAITIIRQERINAERALDVVIKDLGEVFAYSPEELLQDRRRDLLDIVERIIANLNPTKRKQARVLGKRRIIVSQELSPSQLATLSHQKVIGLVMEVGSPTSHAAIIARAMDLPTVVGTGIFIETLKEEETVIVDGETGQVIIDPDRKTLLSYKQKQKRLASFQKRLQTLVHLPAKTRDGHRVNLLANIEFPEEAVSVGGYGGEGIGLYRTEYLYLNRNDLPSEEEQFQAYRRVAELMKEKPVVIRTIDLGGDKFPSHLGFGKERNPFLGWRAIRICLERPDIFISQIKAVLRAAVYGHLKIMIPMVATVEEVQQTKQVIDRSVEILRQEGKPFREEIPLGVLIEVPAAALLCHRLATMVDFFSIGTNDLIQYTLAADRGNERTTHLYQPCHPAILSLITTIVEQAHAHQIRVGLCGEMAATPEIACLLVALGVDELSMAPAAIPRVKESIRRVTWKRLVALRDRLKDFSTHSEIYSHLKNSLADVLQEN